MSRALPRDELSFTDLVCGEAVLEAFDVPGRGRGTMNIPAIKGFLEDAGYRLTSVIRPCDQWLHGCGGNCGNPEWLPDVCPQRESGWPTLTRFIREHPIWDFVLFTASHAMALRDGRLTDTDETAGGRRIVHDAYEVTRGA